MPVPRTPKRVAGDYVLERRNKLKSSGDQTRADETLSRESECVQGTTVGDASRNGVQRKLSNLEMMCGNRQVLARNVGAMPRARQRIGQEIPSAGRARQSMATASFLASPVAASRAQVLNYPQPVIAAVEPRSMLMIP